MKATHRIYLKTGLARQPEQVEAVTAQFIEINIKQYVEAEKSRWYRVTGAGGQWTYRRFFDINDQGVHEILGMRMLLRGKHWYANAQDLKLSLAYPYEEDEPFRIPWRPLVFVAIALAFALILAATEQHIFGWTFTWKQYSAWAVVVLTWMAIMEAWDRGRL
jgi:hypothetical protein